MRVFKGEFQVLSRNVQRRITVLQGSLLNTKLSGEKRNQILSNIASLRSALKIKKASYYTASENRLIEESKVLLSEVQNFDVSKIFKE